MNLTATETEDLLWRVKMLEQRVAELERSVVRAHRNPWPDNLPYQPWSPMPQWPEVILTEQQKEGIRRMMEQFKKEKPVE